jgi:lysophospholipase L1-like esterase
MTGRAAGKQRGWAAVLAWNAVVLACGLVVLELAFGEWLFGDGMPFYVQRNARIEYDCSGLYRDCHTVEYSRDRWGLRGGNPDPSRIEILTVGGSTTDQRYVSLPATWQAVLAHELGRTRGHDAIVANAGIDGMSTIGHLHALEHWFPRIPGLRPAMVIYMVGVNDRLLPGGEPEDIALANRWSRNLKEQSALIRLGRVLRGMYWAQGLGLPVIGHDREVVSDLAPEPNFALKVKQFSDREQDRLSAYRRRIEAIAALTRQRLGATPVFVTQVTALLRLANPPLVSTSGEDEAIRLAALNGVTLETCAAVSAICVDLADDVAFAEEDFYDEYHTTPSGAAKIGQRIARSVR